MSIDNFGLYLALALAFSSFLPVSAQESPSKAVGTTVSDSEGISLTIYNQNFGLVRDLRSVNLKDGVNYLRFEDVASQIDPTSVSFSSLTAPNSLAVREQNYQYDLVDPSTILSKSVGKTLRIRRYMDNGTVKELNGTLLSSVGHGGGLVLKTSDGVVLNPQGEIEVTSLPEGLVSKPSLLWKLESTKAGEQKTEIAYQTNGMNWHCDYVAVLNKDDSLADLTSWVTIDNRSGSTYKNASLKLLAGDVHRVSESRSMPRGAMMMKAAAAPASQFSEKSFAEYHLYSLQGKTTLANNETKQMSLFNASEIPVKKLFVYEPEAANYGYRQNASQKVAVKFELVNSLKNHLGVPMPKGKVRVYKKDQDASLQFIGEDLIDHSPVDEKIRLYIGDAFDLVGEKKQTNYINTSSLGRDKRRISYEISLRNHKDSAVTITAVEHAWGDWKIANSSLPYTKKDSHTFEFVVQVPAHGETKLNYEIELR